MTEDISKLKQQIAELEATNQVLLDCWKRANQRVSDSQEKCFQMLTAIENAVIDALNKSIEKMAVQLSNLRKDDVD